MIGFLIVAALLTAAALFYVVPPLLGKRASTSDISHQATNVSIYRDQLRELELDLENGAIDRLQYDSARQELERRALEEVEQESDHSTSLRGPQWMAVWVVALAVPVIAVPMYLLVGSPLALDPARVEAMAAANSDQHALTPERIAQMVGQLEQRLQSNPADVEGWVMLARSKMAMERPAEAVAAYRRAIALVPNDAQLLADFADTLALAQGRSLRGEPEQLIAKALLADPENVKALALSGTVAFQNQDYPRAATQWQRVLSQLDPASDFAQRMQASIDEAKARGGMTPASVPPSQAAGKPAVTARAVEKSAQPAASSGATVAGRVSLSAATKEAVSPDDTVFVFARAAEGPRIPLAVLRVKVRDLPTEFELNESMAMAPGMSLAQFSELLVGARVSRSGSATPAAGDWESALIPVQVGARGLRLVVSERRG